MSIIFLYNDISGKTSQEKIKIFLEATRNEDAYHEQGEREKEYHEENREQHNYELKQ